MGKRERDRLRSLDGLALSTERRPRREKDEIAADRGVILLPERGGMFHLPSADDCVLKRGTVEPAGSRMPLHLASVTRAPTLQHIAERINLISAQHNLGPPPRTVASLMVYAFEVRTRSFDSHDSTL